MLTRLRDMRSRDDDGFTLTELLITMMVLGILSAMVLSITISVLRNGRQAQAHVVGTSQAQAAMERISRDLRVADPLVTATANDSSAKVYRAGACQLVRWYLSPSGALLQDTQKYAASTSCATATGTPSAVVTNVLVSKVENTSAKPIFTFARWDTTANPPALIGMASPVASTSVSLVDRITVQLRVSQAEGRQPIVVQSAVDLRNVVHNQ